MPTPIAAYLVYTVGRLFFSKKTSVFLAFAYAFSTISWPFATYFFQSDVSAMFDLLAVYFCNQGHSQRWWKVPRRPLRGVLGRRGADNGLRERDTHPHHRGVPGLLVSEETHESLAGFAIGFLIASFVGILLVGLYNEAIFGTAFHTTEQVYLNSPTPFGEFSTPIYQGVYLNLFSPLRGLFVYSIFLVLGVFGLAEMMREKRHRAEAVLLLACFLGILLPYSAWYDPVGGAAFGPRFLVSAIPFLLLPAGPGHRGRKQDDAHSRVSPVRRGGHHQRNRRRDGGNLSYD